MRTTVRRRHVTNTEPTSTRAAHPARNIHETAPPDERGMTGLLKALANAVLQRSRLSPRFIVGDQHNTTRTTQELSFGSRKHDAPTGLAQRTSPPPGGSIISNREACKAAAPEGSAFLFLKLLAHHPLDHAER